MADNLSTTAVDNLLNDWGTAAIFVQLHTGDPGSAGTALVSSTTTRESVTWNSASAGTMTASNSPEWSSWSGTNGEIVSDISFWDADSAGNFQGSMELQDGSGNASPVTMNTSDSLTLNTISVSFPTAS